MTRARMAMVVWTVGVGIRLLHADGGSAMQALGREEATNRTPLARSARSASECPQAARSFEVVQLEYEVPPTLCGSERQAVHQAVYGLLRDAGPAKFSFECRENLESGFVCSARLWPGNAGGEAGRTGAEPVDLTVATRDDRAVRVRLRRPVPVDAVLPGAVGAAIVMNSEVSDGAHRYDAVLSPAGEAWVAASHGDGRVLAGDGDGGLDHLGYLPAMTEARRGAVLRYLADHRREFCATDGAASFWLTFDEPEHCAQPALRTWQIWHDGHERADGHRAEPGTLRLQTKLSAATVDIGDVMRLAGKLEWTARRGEAAEEAEASGELMLTRHGELIAPQPPGDEGILDYRLAAPSRADMLRLRIEAPAAAPETRFVPVADDDDEEMLHAVVAAVVAGAGPPVDALHLHDLHDEPAGGQVAVFARAPAPPSLSAVWVWTRADQSTAGQLTPVTLVPGTDAPPERQPHIAATLRGVVRPGQAVHLRGNEQTLRLCSAARRPWRRVADDGADQMDVPLWAGGEEVACADHLEHAWEPTFAALAAIAERLRDGASGAPREPRALQAAAGAAARPAGAALHVAMAPAEQDLIAVRDEPMQDEPKRYALWRTAEPPENTQCRTGLGGSAAAALVRYLSRSDELTCQQTVEHAPELEALPWAAGIRASSGKMVLLTEECEALTLHPLGPDDPAAAEGVPDVAKQFRRFVHRAPGCAPPAPDHGAWFVAMNRLFVVVDPRLSLAADEEAAADLDRGVAAGGMRMVGRWLASQPAPPASGLRAAPLADGEGGARVMIGVGPESGVEQENERPDYDDVGVVLDESRCAGRVARGTDERPVVFPRDRETADDEDGEGYRCEQIVVSLKLLGRRWQRARDADGREVRGTRGVALDRHIIVTPPDDASLVECLRELARAEVSGGCAASVSFETAAGESLRVVNDAVPEDDRRVLLEGVLKGALEGALEGVLKGPDGAVDLVAAVSGADWRLHATGAPDDGLLPDDGLFLLTRNTEDGPPLLRFNHFNLTCLEIGGDEVRGAVETLLVDRESTPDRTGLEWVAEIETRRRSSPGADPLWWHGLFTRDPRSAFITYGRDCTDASTASR